MPQPHRPRLRSLAAAACLIMALALLSGCSTVVTDAQAPGTYTAATDWGSSTVTLYPNHAFDQTVSLKNGQSKLLHGAWEIHRSTGDPVYTTINLSPFFNVTHDKQGVYTLVSVVSIYHVPFGGINMAADPNYGIAYRRESRR